MQHLPRRRHRVGHGPHRLGALDRAPHQPAHVHPGHGAFRRKPQHVDGRRRQVPAGQLLQRPVHRRHRRVVVERQLPSAGPVRPPGRVGQHAADLVRGRRVVAGAPVTRVHDQVQVVQGERARHPQVRVRPAHVLQRAEALQQGAELRVRVDLGTEGPAQGSHQPGRGVLYVLRGRARIGVQPRPPRQVRELGRVRLGKQQAALPRLARGARQHARLRGLAPHQHVHPVHRQDAGTAAVRHALGVGGRSQDVEHVRRRRRVRHVRQVLRHRVGPARTQVDHGAGAELPHARPAAQEPARLRSPHLHRRTAVRHLHHPPQRHAVLGEVVDRPPRLKKRDGVAERPFRHRIELGERGDLPQDLEHRLVRHEVGVGHRDAAERAALVADRPRLDRMVRDDRAVQRGDEALVRHSVRPQVVRVTAEPAAQRKPLRPLVLDDDPVRAGHRIEDQAHLAAVRPDAVPACPERQGPGHGQTLVAPVVQHQDDRHTGREPGHPGVTGHQLHELLPGDPRPVLAPGQQNVVVAALGHHHVGTRVRVPHRFQRSLELAVAPLPHPRRVHRADRPPGEVQSLVRAVPRHDVVLVVQRAPGRQVIGAQRRRARRPSGGHRVLHQREQLGPEIRGDLGVPGHVQDASRQGVHVDGAARPVQETQPLQLGDGRRLRGRDHLGRHPARTTRAHAHGDLEQVRQVPGAEFHQRLGQIVQDRRGDRLHPVPCGTATAAEPRQHHLGRRHPGP